MKRKCLFSRLLVATSLLVLCLMAGCTTTRGPDRATEDAAAVTQIERRLREIFEAAIHKDFERLESYHLYGPKFTRFSGSSPTRQDAAATRRLERDGLAALEGLAMEARDTKIDVFGTVAIVTFVLDYGFEWGEGTVRKKERSTLVFAQENGDWKIVHEHLSTIPPAEPRAAAKANSSNGAE